MSQVQAPDRRYLSLDGFSQLVRGVKDVAAVETSKLAVISKMPVAVKALGGENSGLIEFVITTDRVDREQDVVAADGWDFKDYDNNPVVLWCHDHYAPVIGNSRSLSPSGNLVKSICEFTPADLNPFGWMIYQLYAKAFMHAVSVGFQPKEFTYADDRKYGVNYIKQSLLEYSCVPVPANPDALVVARSKGINLQPLKQWAERNLDEGNMSDEARRRMEVLRTVSAPSGRALISEMGDTTMEKETPANTTVKRLERWGCADATHVHTSEVEAKACEKFDIHVTEVTRSLQGLQSLVKSGKTIKAEQLAVLRAVMDEIAPAPAKKGAEEPSQPAAEEVAVQVTEGDATINVSEEELAKMVGEGVTKAFNAATGRVD